MEQLKKTIKGLECCVGSKKVEECGWKDGDFPECPYNDNTDECVMRLLQDALSLLKAQEPILLKNQHKPGGHIINANSPWVSRCPKCNKKIEGKQTRFCKYCGQAVKWE